MFPTGSIKGVAPRWPFLAAARKSSSNLIPTAPTSPLLDTYVLAYDSKKEESIGLGRQWGRRELGESECYASKPLLTQLGTLMRIVPLHVSDSHIVIILMQGYMVVWVTV
jgi:hypothetical protein